MNDYINRLRIEKSVYLLTNTNLNINEILEVNENASKEVIDKAYKVLAKKYHPDLQEEKNKKAAEEKIKSLNEAYEILSNPKKKQAYDAKIARLKQEEENRKKQNKKSILNTFL